jgi:hypothetical protein
MLHEYHVIYSVQYYLRFHITAVGLGTYYLWIRGHYCIVYIQYFIILILFVLSSFSFHNFNFCKV